MTQTYPKISIITPSYNQGQYIEETILSVIGQNYPNLEYIIIDGGSTDNTVEIIKKYEKHLTYWVSEPDNGQSHAINKGFAIATGDILAWLNSDDVYMPNVLGQIPDQINIDELELVFGNVIHFNNETLQTQGSNVGKKYNSFRLPFDTGFIIQPSTFWTRLLWEKVGKLDESKYYTFDWLWFLKAIPLATCKVIPKYLSMYRIHATHKSSTGGNKRFQEVLNVLKENNFEKYASILEKAVPKKQEIYTLIDRIKRVGLGRFKNKILRYKYPDCFKGLSDEELEEMIIKLHTVYF